MMRGTARVVVVIADVDAAIKVKLAAALVRGRVVLLTKADDIRLKAVITATTIDVGLILAVSLAAEVEVGHFESVSECIALKRTVLLSDTFFQFYSKKIFYGFFCFLFFVFFFGFCLAPTLQHSEVSHAIARKRLCELAPLGLIRMDELTAALQVQLTACRPTDAMLVRSSGLRSPQNSLVLEVATGPHDLLLELAAAVTDDALSLHDLASCGGASHLLRSLSRLRGLEEVAQPPLVGI
jgi:hypothetical protein